MPRFNIRKYDPTADSSAGTEGVAEGSVVLKIALGPTGPGCPCGCNTFPKGAKATFAMGHDATLRGKLLRAHMTETKIVEVVDGQIGMPIDAMDVAARHRWQEVLRAAEAKREQANRTVAARALGSRRTIKVGRWDYTGQVVRIDDHGSRLQIEYVTRQGEIKRAWVKQEEASDG